MRLGTVAHRRLQSRVGTWARLGYAVFDSQLRKAYFVTTLYTYVCACVSMYMRYSGSSCLVLVI